MTKIKGILIVFTGIDGSGKTTLAKNLTLTLRKNNINAKYVYNTYRPLLLLPAISLARITLLRGKHMYNNPEGKRAQKIIRNRAVSNLYMYLVIFDYCFQTFFKVKIPLMFGKILICDRYVYDLVINFVAELDLSVKEMKKLLAKLFYVLPKPDMVFLVDVNEEVAYKRKSDIPSKEFLAIRRSIYLSIANQYEMEVLDGTKMLEKLQKDLKGAIFKCLRL